MSGARQGSGHDLQALRCDARERQQHLPLCIVKPFPTLRLAEGVYWQPPLHDAWVEPTRVAAPAS